MCLPLADGGLGFDYRLNMGLPDFLIKLMKQRDEQWFLGALWYELTNRRPQEKVIGYTESHDQALVGDKTLMFWLADKDMYWHMAKSDHSGRIDRALALHKMFRFIACAAGGEAYLNFMGNEFGHPEWVDFPREGNGGSYYYARRQWHLVDDGLLKYGYLRDFDQAMLEFLAKPDLRDKPAEFLMIHEEKKILAFAKGDYVFVFNFHPRDSFVYEWGEKKPPKPSRSALVFHSAWQRFGGFVDEAWNPGLVREDGVVVDYRTAVVVRKAL
jgi:1,4-alpha-glucan branching enzyme